MSVCDFRRSLALRFTHDHRGILPAMGALAGGDQLAWPQRPKRRPGEEEAKPWRSS